MAERWYVLPLNPEPWAVGDIGIGRKGGKTYARMSPNANLVAFQEAVKEELEGVEMMPDGEYSLSFYFWRQQAEYISKSDRRVKRHVADATNMQKALEDALQGVLFTNDRMVKEIKSVVVEQGYKVNPKIIIRVSTSLSFKESEIPAGLLLQQVQELNNESDWKPEIDLF